MYRQRRLQCRWIWTVNAKRDVRHFLNRRYQPLKKLDFVVREDAGVDVDHVGSRGNLIQGQFSDVIRLPVLNRRGHAFYTAVYFFTDDQHASPSLRFQNLINGTTVTHALQELDSKKSYPPTIFHVSCLTGE